MTLERLEPAALRSPVKHSTTGTEPLCSHNNNILLYIAFCMLGNFSCFSFSLLSFFSKHSFRTLTGCHMVWIQTVCKGYQQMTKVIASMQIFAFEEEWKWDERVQQIFKELHALRGFFGPPMRLKYQKLFFTNLFL